MARYFFDCHYNGTSHLDDYGMDMAHDEVADQAFEVVLELMREAEISRRQNYITVRVRDYSGVEVYVFENRLTSAYATLNQDVSLTNLR